MFVLGIECDACDVLPVRIAGTPVKYIPVGIGYAGDDYAKETCKVVDSPWTAACYDVTWTLLSGDTPC